VTRTRSKVCCHRMNLVDADADLLQMLSKDVRERFGRRYTNLNTTTRKADNAESSEQCEQSHSQLLAIKNRISEYNMGLLLNGTLVVGQRPGRSSDRSRLLARRWSKHASIHLYLQDTINDQAGYTSSKVRSIDNAVKTYTQGINVLTRLCMQCH
jgi:hypothetical protein